MSVKRGEPIPLTWWEAQSQIDSCKYLFAEEVGERSELEFRFRLVEAKPQVPIVDPGDYSEAALLRLGGRPIEYDLTCRIFEVVFAASSLISYTVVNESYSRFPEPPKTFTGKLCRTYSWSYLLEWSRQTTDARDGYPYPFEHYEFACLNHVIDVLAGRPPLIFQQERVVHKAGGIALGNS